MPAAALEGETGRVGELLATGALRAPVRRLADGFWERPRPADAEARLLDAMLEERRSGR